MEAIVVLGSGHERRLRERAIASYIYARQHKIYTIIFSGGREIDGTSEAQRMSDMFPASDYRERVFDKRLEEVSGNTKENLEKLLPIIQENSISEIHIVTNGDHIYRVKRDMGDILDDEISLSFIDAENVLRSRLGKSKKYLYQCIFSFLGLEFTDKYIYPRTIIGYPVGKKFLRCLNDLGEKVKV